MASISIVIPTFNRAGLIKECLQSCAKLGPSTELVVVDDCSTDDTTAVVASLATEFNQVDVDLRCLAPGKNSGAQVCRNLGLAATQRDYVMFVDSDDVIAPSGVLTALRLIEQERCDFVFGKVQRVDEKLSPLNLVLPGTPFADSGRDLAGYHWHTMGAIYRRDLLARVGPWNESLTGSQDWEYQARIKLQARSKIFCPEIMGLWREHNAARVGTRKFRHDYVRSVITACLSIATHAQAAHRYDRGLAWALAKKLFLHGLELSAHSYGVEARQVFTQVQRLPLVPKPFVVLMALFAHSPQLLNSFTYRAIQASR
jgi:glycosyltransferase involved in cell wall biosynthesis